MTMPQVVCELTLKGSPHTYRVVGMYREGKQGKLKLATLFRSYGEDYIISYDFPSMGNNGVLDTDRVVPALSAGGGATWTYRRSPRVVLTVAEMVAEFQKVGLTIRSEPRAAKN